MMVVMVMTLMLMLKLMMMMMIDEDADDDADDCDNGSLLYTTQWFQEGQKMSVYYEIADKSSQSVPSKSQNS